MVDGSRFKLAPILFVVLVIASGVAVWFILSKAPTRTQGFIVPSEVSSRLLVAGGSRLPQEVHVSADGALDFRAGTVFVPSECRIVVDGTLEFPFQALEPVRFLPASASESSSLTIEFKGDGVIRSCSFEGYTGPVGEPRMRLHVSASGELAIVNTSLQGVGRIGRQPLFVASRRVSATGLRYEGDNRQAVSDAPIIKGPEVVVSDSELRGLTAFSYPFDCQNLAMTNSVLRGVIAQSLSRTPLEVLTWTTVRSASSAFERGIDARTVKIDQCSLALNTAATIRTSELTVENSVIMATKIALAAETARITGSILVASQGSVSVGTDRESDGLLVSGRSIALAGCLVSFEMPIEHLWKSFVAGELEAPVVPEKAVGLLLEKNLLVWSGKAGAIETEAPPGAPVDARSNTVLCESADQLPDGFSHVERVGNSVPGTITTRCPGNETLARVIRDLFPERGD